MKKAIVVSALTLALASSTAFAGNLAEISGNGEDTENGISQLNASFLFVGNSNDADVVNALSVESSSGDNDIKVSDNRRFRFPYRPGYGHGHGGDEITIKNNSVTTGDSEANGEIVNNVNGTEIHIDPCDCTGEGDQALVLNNEADSENWLDQENLKDQEIVNENDADLANIGEVESESGDNDIKVRGGEDVTLKGNSTDTGNSFAGGWVANTVNVFTMTLGSFGL